MEQRSSGAIFRAGFMAGLTAGLAMLLLTVAFRLALGSPSLQEAMADWFTRVLPPGAFEFLLTHLQTWAKPLMFAGLLAATWAAAGLVGGAHALWAVRLPVGQGHPWRSGLALGMALWLLQGVILAPLIGAGLLGSTLAGGAPPFALATGVSTLVYGFAVGTLVERLRARPSARDEEARTPDRGRRDFLKRMAIGSAILAGGGFVVRSLVQGLGSIQPSRVFGQAGRMPSLVTPTDQFYVVSKNIVDPEVEVRSWKLRVKGEVERPLAITYDDLRAMPATEQFTTLTCISNRVGGDLIGNAKWKGVRLRYLLERAGVKEGARKVAFFAADGYSDSIPREVALRDDVLVAYEMNGEPLTREHGSPARLLVPGLYGLKSVKWLTGIEPVASDFQGYWQERGWSDEAVVKTVSRIDVPESGRAMPLGTAALGGVAFAGLRGVSAVEFSADRGATWHQARVGERLGTATWVLWTQDWTPPAAGTYILEVRAVDGPGEVQTAQVADSYPDGATGHHRVTITFTERDRT